jgi:hypothetical protein
LIPIHRALCTSCFAILGILNVSSAQTTHLQAGLMTGYTYGQNGAAWPSLTKDPLGNDNRGGFYVSQLRLKGAVEFDSSFSAVAVGNLYFADIQEAYLQKQWQRYTFRLGKFRGAGLKSGSGTDEFERTSVNAPMYANLWGYYTRTLGFRDFGAQAEADFAGGDVKHRLFIHNTNRQNVINTEPSENAGVATQALGFDYALDWRVSPFTAWGGHVGALANSKWDEFVGTHKGWEVGYWFKSNPLVDGSIYHQMDVNRFHMFNEALLMYNREIPNPADGGATKTWGLSSMVRFDQTPKAGWFFRYEAFDHTDGAFSNDMRNLFTLGSVYRPAPESYPGLRVTTEYVRVLEEDFRNTVSNDLFLCQLQMLY